ncbi:hypothetical protein [Hyalangium sp.]|uniref:hypothetical protein n=1 Tax=Hyalangium sp. TaxID=2028555 RepID=UPI002D74C07C|nr:hypothetical protein [Hyalangium sp.]HYH98244.1 hypothetical protein [Hyalangium sp.]
MAQPDPQALPVPPHVYQAQAQLAADLENVEGKPVDLLKAPWGDVEKSVLKLVGGAFQANRREQQMLALGLAGAFAARLSSEHQAFWFPNRDSPEGFSLGFPAAIIMLSPFGAVMDGMSQGNLSMLEKLAADIRNSLGQVRFNAGAAMSLGGQPKLGPADYQRLFDPGFLQFVVLDPAKAKSTFESKPDSLARDVKDALGRTQPPLPQESRQQFEGQIVMSLQRLEASKPLAEQVERAPRLVELMAHMVATVGGTGCAPEEFWGEIVLPLLFIGVPQQFPPLDEEELEAYKQGAEPLALFVDMVPHAHKAPEEGLLGTFEMTEIGLPHPSFSKVGALRLLQVDPSRIRGLLEQFDPDKTLDVVKRFTQYLAEKSGKPAEESPQGKEMMQAAMMLLADLKRAVTTEQGPLCLRRLTEAEAASEQALALVRKAMQGGRIILTS